MTLLERADLLLGRAVKYRERQEREVQAKDMRARTASLSRQLDRLVLIKAKHAALKGLGIEMEPLGEFHPELLSKYEDERVHGGGTSHHWERFALALRSFVEKFEKDHKANIENIKNQLLGSVGSSELAGYVIDPETKLTAERLKGVHQKLNGSNWEELTAERLVEFIEDARRFIEDYKAMQEKGASPEVRKFLTDARSAHGASLSQFTDSIRNELTSRKLLPLLKVVFK
jgi:hypothetical protein